MREQLIQYVNLLFAGVPDSEEMKQEILQNTLDRYDDLVSQGKSPEAAYRLAISGIGDINEILGSTPKAEIPDYSFHHSDVTKEEDTDTPEQKKNRAVAIAMYILSPVPLFILSEFGLDTLGLCLTLVLVAAATALSIMNKKKHDKELPVEEYTSSPRQKLDESIGMLIWAIGLVVYFVLSFATGAWYITWIIFPIIGCVKGLVKACMDLKEALEYED